MKKARFTESQIISILSKQEKGISVADICREHGISNATFFNWKGKYGGMSPNQLRRLKELEIENVRLKRMYADLSCVHEGFKDAIEKKVWGPIKRGKLHTAW